ncbi:MAG: hypothetical protein M9928_23370 [Anaerolineae bacterium]|nr:hypothetical protein [Anaerolineae bacterium]
MRRFKLFGTLEIDDDGLPSRVVQSDRGSALVCYLIVTGEAQPREFLADLLWESTSSQQALKHLRQLVSRIRPWVPELVVTRKTLAFQPHSDTVVDYYVLRDALSRGTMDALEEALIVYRGELLANFTVTDAPRFTEWLLITREQLRMRMEAIFQRVIADHAAHANWQRAVDFSRRWLALDDLNEAAYRHLITMLAAVGDFRGATQMYEQCRLRLWQELGVEPEDETRALLKQLQQAVVATSPALSSTSPPALPGGDLAEPGPLPPQSRVMYRRNNTFAGRINELLQLASWLLPDSDDKPAVRAAVVKGIGGIGKTQLAVEYCFRYGRYYSGGVYWLNFGVVKDVLGEVAATGDQRGLRLFHSMDKLTLAEQVGRVQQVWQEPVPRLLIFDSCEDESLLMEWLPVTGGCSVLVTSRRGYWSADLGIVTLSLPLLTLAQSAGLLQTLAPHLTPQEAEAIAEEVGRLPLALHLAGGFLRRYRQITPVRYLQELRAMGGLSHPSLHGRGTQLSPTGHVMDVAHTVALSVAQLNDSAESDIIARRLFTRAACFAPGEPLSWSLLLATVLPADADMETQLSAEDGLIRLISLGLLEYEGDEHVIMHRLVAGFALRMDADEHAAALADVARALLEPLTTRLGRAPIQLALPYAVAHLRHATDAALAQGHPSANRLAIAMGQHLQAIAEYDAAAAYAELALAAAAPDDAYGQGVACYLQGIIAGLRGNELQSLMLMEEAERRLRPAAVDHPVMMAIILKQKGWILGNRYQTEAALAAAQESAELAAQANDPAVTIAVLNLQALLDILLLNRFERAEERLRAALILVDQYGVEESRAPIIGNLGETAKAQGDFEQAIAWFIQSRDLSRHTGVRSQELLDLSNLHHAQVEAGHFREAEVGARSLLTRMPEDWHALVGVYRTLAIACLKQDKIADALTAAESALAAAQSRPSSRALGHAWHTVARVVAAAQANPQHAALVSAYDAHACFVEAQHHYDTLNSELKRAELFWHWALYELAHGDTATGEKLWREAWTLFEQLALWRFIVAMEASRAALLNQ